MSLEDELRQTPPGNLVDARNMAHQAMQLVSKASLANLEPKPDYSHNNMGWDKRFSAFLTQPMHTSDGNLYVGLCVATLTLLIVRDDAASAQLHLGGVSDSDACSWLDRELGQAGLKPVSAANAFYELPRDVTGIEAYAAADLESELRTLGSWFAFADGLLAEFAQGHTAITPGASPVRCWPHHFDIASYVSLEEGDVEIARGIGVGLSPGDGSYAQPYIYVTPFPAPNLATLPEAPAPGHWHTEGFVGAIATGDEILTLGDIASGTAMFIDQAFAIGREKLGA